MSVETITVVIGAFFSVWTIQRTKEIGLVKAIGASSWYLVRDALSQAFFLIVAATLAGGACALWFGYAVEDTELPFMLETPILARYLRLPPPTHQAPHGSGDSRSQA